MSHGTCLVKAVAHGNREGAATSNNTCMHKAATDNRDLEEACRGDGQAFARLVLPLEKKLYQLALGITGCAEDAEDAWQNTLVKAWRGITKLREADAFPAWLTTIVLNEARRIARKKKIQKAIADVVLRHGGDATSLRASPQLHNSIRPNPTAAPGNPDPAVSADDRLDILVCLQALKPEQSEAILLRYWLDLTLEEIAKVTGVPLNTAKTRLYRGLERLKDLLEGSSSSNSYGRRLETLDGGRTKGDR